MTAFHHEEAFVQSADFVVVDVGFNFTFEGEPETQIDVVLYSLRQIHCKRSALRCMRFIPPATGGDRQYLTLRRDGKQ